MIEPFASIARSIRGMAKRELGHIVARALDIGPPSSGMRGKLRVRRITGQLQVEWHARDVHPWDQDLPLERRAELFTDQTIADTDTVVTTLFRLLPEIGTIAVQVRTPEADGDVILAGTINRASIAACRPVLSARMRLKMMGLRYGMSDDELEVLSDSSSS
jgi:hypothetical protein